MIGIILIVLLLIRIPVFIYDFPLLLSELTWQLIGDKMSAGFVLYRDIWTTMEPFSGGVYAGIDLIFGKSHLAYQILAFCLIFIQAIIFNMVVNINNLYADRTYVPAFLYVIFSSLFIDFYTLSPPMMGMVFILLAIHFIFIQIRVSEDDESFFYAGCFIAIAALFYYPFWVFILLALLSFLLFSGIVIRRYFLLIMGFLFPHTLVAVYYLFRGGLNNLLISYQTALFSDTEILLTGTVLGAAIIVPSIIVAVSFFVIFSNSKYINFQYVAIRIFALWLILSFITLYFTRTLSTYHLFVFVPALAFMGSHLFLLIKKKMIREVSFAVCAITILWMNYKVLYDLNSKKIDSSYERVVVMESPETSMFQDKKLLVLSNNRAYYKNNHLATPYFNWGLSQKHFSDLNNYGNLSQIYNNFEKDMPEVIIDENNIIPALFNYLPLLEKEYKKLPGKNIYVMK